MRNIFTIIGLLTIILITHSCNYCKLFGDNKLGNNFSLLEGDAVEDRVIVYCTGKSGGCCYTGIPVIPAQTDSLSSYVLETAFNDRWIVAKTINENLSEKYWIIDKDFSVEIHYDDGGKLDSILQSHVHGPFDWLNYNKEIERLSIDIELNK